MKQESPIWKKLKRFRRQTKTNGLSGKERRYYEWDHTHGDIEEYNSRGEHLGSMHAITGEIYKPPVEGRRIDIHD
jgi:hypothetical protein